MEDGVCFLAGLGHELNAQFHGIACRETRGGLVEPAGLGKVAELPDLQDAIDAASMPPAPCRRQLEGRQHAPMQIAKHQVNRFAHEDYPARTLSHELDSGVTWWFTVFCRSRAGDGLESFSGSHPSIETQMRVCPGIAMLIQLLDCPRALRGKNCTGATCREVPALAGRPKGPVAQ